MNKFKKAAQALRAYLGSDQEGKEFLDALVRIGNNTKSELDACKSEVERQKLLKDAAQLEADEALRKESDARKELEQERAMREQRDFELLELRRQLAKFQKEEEEGPEISSSLYSHQSFHSISKALVKWKKYCPSPQRVIQTYGTAHFNTDRVYCYELSQLISSASAPECMNLGRMVVALAMFGSSCLVSSDKILRDFKDGTTEKERLSKFRHFRLWFGENCIQESKYESINKLEG